MKKILDEMDGAMYFRPFAPEKVDVGLLFSLAESIRKRLVIEFQYTKFMATKWSEKTVRPYCLICAANSWYLIAFDEESGEMRTYMLSRLKKLNVTVRKFKKPKRWKLEKYLEGAFIILKGQESHHVVVEFDAWAAAYIRNRDFTSDQKVEELPNGGLRISMHLTALEEVEAWVCNWRKHATVIGPQVLRDRLADYSDDLRKKYGKSEEERARENQPLIDTMNDALQYIPEQCAESLRSRLIRYG